MPQSNLTNLFIPTVLCVLLSAFRLPICASVWVVEDMSVGLNDVLLLFEIHLQHSLDKHKHDATLWVKRTFKHKYTKGVIMSS